MQNLRLGVAGAGYWGPNLIRNCAELGILDSVCDLDESALAAVVRSYPGVATTTQFEELLARQVQGVIIATPAHLHASMCLEAIAAGKHVFVEKPLALTVSEGEQIAQAAAHTGLIVFVGHVLIYHPAVRKLRALLAEDVIGPIWHLRSRRLSLGKLRNHESVWWSFAPHDIALMLAIMGEEPRSVLSAQTASTIAEISDVAYADFQFSNNRSAHIEVCWLDPEKSARLDVFGAHGVITLKDARAGTALTVSPYAVSTSERGHRSVARGEQREIQVDGGEPLREEMLAFVDAVSMGKQPQTSVQQGVAVLRALSMADAARERSNSATVLT